MCQAFGNFPLAAGPAKSTDWSDRSCELASYTEHWITGAICIPNFLNQMCLQMHLSALHIQWKLSSGGEPHIYLVLKAGSSYNISYFFCLEGQLS